MDFMNNDFAPKMDKEFLPDIRNNKNSEYSTIDIITEINTMPFSESEKQRLQNEPTRNHR